MTKAELIRELARFPDDCEVRAVVHRSVEDNRGVRCEINPYVIGHYNGDRVDAAEVHIDLWRAPPDAFPPVPRARLRVIEGGSEAAA